MLRRNEYNSVWMPYELMLHCGLDVTGLSSVALAISKLGVCLFAIGLAAPAINWLFGTWCSNLLSQSPCVQC